MYFFTFFRESDFIIEQKFLVSIHYSPLMYLKVNILEVNLCLQHEKVIILSLLEIM